MGIKRLFKKNLLGGGDIVRGHIVDAIKKKRETGKTFRECLGESVKETITEDLPGTSHIYQSGHKDGKKEGTNEQAERDKKKMEEMNKNHEKDRSKWEKEKREYDDLLNDVEQKM